MKVTEGPTPYSIVAVLIVSMGPFLFGYNTAIISGALLFLGDSFTLTITDKGVVVSILLAGAILGALLAGTLTDRLGRRAGLILNGALFLIGGYWATVASSYHSLLLARFLVGVGVGITSQAAPLYLSEIAPVRSRGSFVSAFQLSITIGILVAFGVGFAYAHERDWRAMFALSLIPAAVLFVGMFFMCESPSWLLGRGEEGKARKALARLRDPVQWEEHQNEVGQVKKKERSQLLSFAQAGSKRALALALVLSAFQQITGINTVIYFAPEILQIAGFTTSETALFATVGIGVVNVVATVIALWVLDKVGRKPLLLGGIIGMVLALGCLGTAFMISAPWASFLALGALLVYVASFAVSLGPIVWVLIAEIFPLPVRAQGMGVSACLNWTCNGLVALTFLDLLYTLGSSLTFFLFALIGCLAALFTWKMVPETKGRTVEQIQKLLKKGAP